MTARVEIKTLHLEAAKQEALADRFGSIVEKVALKSTTTNVQKNWTNYLQYMSPEPINFASIPEQMPKLVTAEALMKGERCFNAMISSTRS